MTSRAEEYRRYARQCLEIAPTFQDEEARATLLDFARAWLRLAHLALANRYIAEFTVQIAHQRVIVKQAFDTIIQRPATEYPVLFEDAKASFGTPT